MTVNHNLISICVIGYIFGAAVTFGQVENRLAPIVEQMPHGKYDLDTTGLSYFGAALAAAVWPFYWPLRISDEVFDPKGFQW